MILSRRIQLSFPLSAFLRHHRHHPCLLLPALLLIDIISVLTNNVLLVVMICKMTKQKGHGGRGAKQSLDGVVGAVKQK